MVRRHHLFADSRRLAVSGDGQRLVFAPHRGLGFGRNVGGHTCRDGVAAGVANARFCSSSRPRALSQRPGQPICKSPLQELAGRLQHAGQHEWHRRMPGQRRGGEGFGTLKAELLGDQPGRCFASKRQTWELVGDYIDNFYNLVRRHSALGYKSPIAFEMAQRTK